MSKNWTTLGTTFLSITVLMLSFRLEVLGAACLIIAILSWATSDIISALEKRT